MTPMTVNCVDIDYLEGAANIVDNKTLSVGWSWHGRGGNGEETADWGSTRGQRSEFKAIAGLAANL